MKIEWLTKKLVSNSLPYRILKKKTLFYKTESTPYLTIIRKAKVYKDGWIYSIHPCIVWRDGCLLIYYAKTCLAQDSLLMFSLLGHRSSQSFVCLILQKNTGWILTSTISSSNNNQKPWLFTILM